MYHSHFGFQSPACEIGGVFRASSGEKCTVAQTAASSNTQSVYCKPEELGGGNITLWNKGNTFHCRIFF